MKLIHVFDPVVYCRNGYAVVPLLKEEPFGVARLLELTAE